MGLCVIWSAARLNVVDSKATGSTDAKFHRRARHITVRVSNAATSGKLGEGAPTYLYFRCVCCCTRY